jgi:hypothetical protein
MGETSPASIVQSPMSVRIVTPYMEFLVRFHDRADLFHDLLFGRNGTGIWTLAFLRNQIRLGLACNGLLGDNPFVRRGRLLTRARCSF